jgi:hypothetical protein
MKIDRRGFLYSLGSLSVLSVCGLVFPADTANVPAFGKDTVLVWNIENMEYRASFVVRIAQFLPDRFIEWEDEQAQGTIFMPGKDILAARNLINSSLFQSGSDMKGKKATTLWLSRQIYRELKENKKVKCGLDGVPGSLKYIGDDQLEVQVNRVARMLPVIKVQDDRGSERWFLDQEENPLMLHHRLRSFHQTLASITTDKENTLRWIKGKKLTNPAGGW